jgi:hypothetical protein
VLGVEAANRCGDELWFGVGMEVSERDQNVAIFTRRNGPEADGIGLPFSADLINIEFAQSYS